MANNKVQLANGTVLIDITDTTANASDVLSGEYFYNASGVKTEGSLIIPSTYTVTKTLTNVDTSNNDTEVLAGGSFYMDLIPSSGMFINSITVTMGGVDVTEQVFKAGVGSKTIIQNGIYDAEDDWLEGYSSVDVNVPNTYTINDEGKVVSNGSLVAQTSETVMQNGVVDTTLINSLTVNVSGGVTPTGTKQISILSNGTTTEDVVNYANAEITVTVPNSYSASDEGKVVSNGTLVTQTSDTVTQNGTVDTTLISSLTVAVSTDGYSARDILYGVAPSGEITLVADANIPRYAIAGRSAITKLTLDMATNSKWFTVSSSNGHNIIYNSIPTVVIIGNTTSNIPGYLFTNNTSALKTIVVRGKVGGMYANAFRANTGLTTLDYTYTSGSIGTNVFYGNSAFDTLIIRGSGVMPLSNVNAFSNSTKFRSAGTGGTLYVPRDLISSYQTASNWSTILGYANNSIVAIEDSIYATQYADGTAI